jgi:hypothetical protein
MISPLLLAVAMIPLSIRPAAPHGHDASGAPPDSIEPPTPDRASPDGPRQKVPFGRLRLPPWRMPWR